MIKKVALITAFEGVASLHYQLLKELFKDTIEIKCYSYDKVNISETIIADLFVISIYPIYYTVKKYIPKNAKTIIISNTITNTQYEELAKIPSGSKVMLVNYSVEMTMETIDLFEQLAIKHLEFIPVYPGVTNIPDLDIAVTPGEMGCVPPFVKQVIDIGHRVLDANTIIDIAMSLNLEHLLKEDHFIKHFQSLKINKNFVTSLFDKTNILESKLSSLINVMDDGIIIIENTGTIHACNNKAKEVLGEKGSLIGCAVSNIIPQIPFDKVFESSEEIGYKLIKINGYDISVKVVSVFTENKICGALAIINRFDEKEKNQHKLRLQLLGKGHRAKYTFNDLISRDNHFMEIITLAKKKAKSDASILITGESGTGKELFTQAIHNASKRKDWQFVAINCAALPESLLESELFGYEEGAFTGAKKGGKIGLIELAHKGTLFLDEIGEMDLNLQARLLRVLEAREVMRIGGDSVIHVDIRIIAATNRALWDLVEEGKFRRDLYYRLNVLPIEIPPLRERKEDILFLFDHIKNTMGFQFELTSEVESILLNHHWNGNVRELRNCVEYLAYLEKDTIDLRDISQIIKTKTTNTKSDSSVNEEIVGFIEKIKFEKDNYSFVLECLYHSYTNKHRIGRRAILKTAQDKDVFLTEAQIRKILNLLAEYGLVRLSNGRGGTSITALGIKTFKLLS